MHLPTLGHDTLEVFDMITKELDAKLAQGGEVVEKETKPIEGMEPGTSGLRKKVQSAHSF